MLGGELRVGDSSGEIYLGDVLLNSGYNYEPFSSLYPLSVFINGTNEDWDLYDDNGNVKLTIPKHTIKERIIQQFKLCSSNRKFAIKGTSVFGEHNNNVNNWFKGHGRTNITGRLIAGTDYTAEDINLYSVYIIKVLE